MKEKIKEIGRVAMVYVVITVLISITVLLTKRERVVNYNFNADAQVIDTVSERYKSISDEIRKVKTDVQQLRIEMDSVNRDLLNFFD